jgi:hypothetical protein
MGNCNYDFNIVHIQCTYWHFVSLIFYSLLKMCAKDIIGNKLSGLYGLS